MGFGFYMNEKKKMKMRAGKRLAQKSVNMVRMLTFKGKSIFSR